MKQTDLLIDFQLIPKDPAGIQQNIARMQCILKDLQGISDIHHELSREILETFPAYVKDQLEVLSVLLDRDAHFISWISRNLFEIFVMLRYMAKSRNHFQRMIDEQLADIKDVEQILCPNGITIPGSPQGVIDFHKHMEKFWTAVSTYGIEKDKLARPMLTKNIASEADLLDEYDRYWRIHSKYVHPTVYFLFGQSYFHGESKPFFLATAQHFAALIIDNLIAMVEQARENE